MPLINHSDGNFYRPGESLQRMFEEAVRHPLRRELPDLWQNLGNWNVLKRVRINVLGRGRTDFSRPYEGPSPLNAGQICYSPAEKVLLYCAFYMKMHLYSSYHVYRTSLPLPRVKVLFVDVGCGPLTSGIAYRAFAEHADIFYIGVDRADEMRKKAKEIDRLGNGEQTLFNSSAFISDYNALPDTIESHVSDSDVKAILINCCYVLASRSLNADRFADALVQIRRRYRELAMHVVYQNPPVKSLHRNWRTVKRRLLINGFAEYHRTEYRKGKGIEPFRYPDLITETTLEKKVEYETLYSLFV